MIRLWPFRRHDTTAGVDRPTKANLMRSWTAGRGVKELLNEQANIRLPNSATPRR